MKNNTGDHGETFRVIIMNRSKHRQPVFCQLTDQNYKSVQTNLQFSFQKNLRRLGEPFVIVEKNEGVGLSKWSNISEKSEGIILSHIWDINRSYLSLSLSPYTIAIMQDEANLDYRIYVFEFKFKNKFQKYPQFSVEYQGINHCRDATEIKTTLRSNKNTDMLFVAKITNHWSMSIKEYMDRVNIDPVLKHTVKSYFDPIVHDHLWKKYGFKDYLNREREIFAGPLI